MSIAKWPKVPQDMMRYATVGIEIFFVFTVFVGLGVWLDRRVGAGIVFTMLGTIIGFAAAMYHMMRVAREYQKKHKSPGQSRTDDAGSDGR